MLLQLTIQDLCVNVTVEVFQYHERQMLLQPSLATSMNWSRTCFNTASSKCCCFITFVLPSLRSGTCNVWASSSLRSSAASHSAAHTVNGRYCYFITFVLPSLCSGTWDVRTSSSPCSSAASPPSAHTVNDRCCCNAKAGPGTAFDPIGFQYRKR